MRRLRRVQLRRCGTPARAGGVGALRRGGGRQGGGAGRGAAREDADGTEPDRQPRLRVLHRGPPPPHSPVARRRREGVGAALRAGRLRPGQPGQLVLSERRAASAPAPAARAAPAGNAAGGAPADVCEGPERVCDVPVREGGRGDARGRVWAERGAAAAEAGDREEERDVRIEQAAG